MEVGVEITVENWSEVDKHIGFMVPFPFEVNSVLRLCIIVTIRVFVLTIVPLPFCGSSSIYIGFIYTQVGGLSLDFHSLDFWIFSR